MGPNNRCIGHQGTDHGSVNPLCNVWAWSPVSAGGGEKGIQEPFSLGGLRGNMVMPPKTAVQGEPKIYTGNGLTGDGESSGGNNTSSREENNLCFRWVEAEATCGTPRDKTIKGVLDSAEKDIRV